MDGGARVSLHPFDEDGRPLAPHVVAKIREVIPKAVSAWSGGLFTNVVLEEVETADETEGWIVLHVVRSRSSEFCGQANYWYFEPGRIATASVELTLDLCGCGSRRITENTISHEIGHAMGFSHVEGRHILTATAQDPCSSLEKQVITERESFHARIAYNRPPGQSRSRYRSGRVHALDRRRHEPAHDRLPLVGARRRETP